jgi:16S rRNA processing protein RimM
MKADPRIEIGGVARAHGIHGEVAIVTHDPDSETIGRVETIFVGGVERKIVEARNTQRGWLVLLEGIATRTEAETLRGQVVEVLRAALELDEDDILLHDLVGCKVQLQDGTPWGVIVEIDAGDMQDRLVIHAGDVERMVPLVDELVTGIDLDAGIVTVDPPVGLPEMKRPKRS